LLATRPIADGLAIGKRLPINCNVFAKQNTRTLKMTTLPQVLPNYLDTHMEEEIPPYLNTACLPYVQQYYTYENFDVQRYKKNGSYSEYDTYMSALKDDEQRKHLIRFA
jgi:hypothetical protein